MTRSPASVPSAWLTMVRVNDRRASSRLMSSGSRQSARLRPVLSGQGGRVQPP